MMKRNGRTITFYVAMPDTGPALDCERHFAELTVGRTERRDGRGRATGARPDPEFTEEGTMFMLPSAVAGDVEPAPHPSMPPSSGIPTQRDATPRAFPHGLLSTAILDAPPLCRPPMASSRVTDTVRTQRAAARSSVASTVALAFIAALACLAAVLAGLRYRTVTHVDVVPHVSAPTRELPKRRPATPAAKSVASSPLGGLLDRLAAKT